MMKKVRSEGFLSLNLKVELILTQRGIPMGKAQEESMIYVRLVAHFFMEEKMEKRVALIGIVVEQYESAEKLNRILHEYGEYVIGRMGIPYREKNMNIISVAVDAPMDVISTLSGKLGMLPGVSSKTIYAKSKKESL